MAIRITNKDLERLIDRLNEVTGSPKQPYIYDETKKRSIAQVGNFHLSGAYGGVCCHRIRNEGGGVTIPHGLPSYHVTKKELYNALHSFLGGLSYDE